MAIAELFSRFQDLLWRPLGEEHFHTSSLEDNSVIPQFVKNLNRARRTVQIASRDMFHQWYNDPKLVKALENLGKRGVDTEIIHGPEADKRNIGIQRLVMQQKIKEYETTHSMVRSDFWLIDGEKVVEVFNMGKIGEREIIIRDVGPFLDNTPAEVIGHLKEEARQL